MIRLLIIGIGNPLRSDDGVGFRVAQDLSRDISRADVQAVAVQQLAPEMAEAVSKAEEVLFLDAAVVGTPGSLKCEPVSPAGAKSHYSHELSPAAIVMLAEQLYGRRPRVHMLTIAGESFATGESLSSSVVAALPDLMAQIRRFIEGGPGQGVV